MILSERIISSKQPLRYLYMDVISRLLDLYTYVLLSPSQFRDRAQLTPTGHDLNGIEDTRSRKHCYNWLESPGITKGTGERLVNQFDILELHLVSNQ